MPTREGQVKMPLIPGIPQRPEYSSVNAYLSDLAMDIAMLVDREKKKRFREQLHIYKKMWMVYEAAQKGCWTRAMGKPEHPLNVLSRLYNSQNDPEKEVRRLAGCYSLLAFIHDSQLPKLNRINNNIIVSSDIIEQTLEATRNQIGGQSIDSKIAETHLIEEYYNRVRVDLKEYCERGTGKSEDEDLSETEEIQKAKTLSDVELFDETARKFKDRSIIPLRRNETWYDLNRSLKPWFDLAIQRLQQAGKTNEIRLLQYEYKNVLRYARGINIKSFRGFPDPRIFELASKQAAELAKKFVDIAREIEKDSVPKEPRKTGQKIESENEPQGNGGEPQAENVFQKTGDFWTVRYGGNTKHIAGDAGIQYIHFLIFKSGETFTTGKFLSEYNEKLIALACGDKILDTEAKKNYKERLKDIDIELENTKSNNDFAKQERLEDEKADITAELLKAAGFARHGKKLNPEYSKYRLSIGNAINRAIKKIDKHLPELAIHLRDSIPQLYSSTSLSYRPPEPIDWML